MKVHVLNKTNHTEINIVEIYQQLQISVEKMYMYHYNIINSSCRCIIVF